mmetsp:Transcript_4066/g.25533  ORF Transcript_4066/g.25533 Transcript_4066/m.25533 type:complete len:96 (-) Transcript_4066:1406-1693(-)
MHPAWAVMFIMPCKRVGLHRLSVHLPMVLVSWHFPILHSMLCATLIPSKYRVLGSSPKVLRQPLVICCRGSTNGLWAAHESRPEEPQRLIEEAQR